MSNVALGRDIGSQVITMGALGVAAATVTTHAGRGINIAALPGGARAQSVRCALAVRGNLDAADTLTVDTIKVESATSNAFSSPVSRVTAADVVLTGAATDTDYFADVALDLDLTSLPESHTWIRVSCRSTLSDTVNTSGVVSAVMVFGGLSFA